MLRSIRVAVLVGGYAATVLAAVTGDASLALFQRHVARFSVAGTEPPRALFHHMHKAGGTTLCQLAVANGMTVPDKHDPAHYSNCNLDDDDDPDNGVELVHSKSCSARSQNAQYSFSGVERWLDAEICDGLVYVTMLREPMSRMKANLAFHALHWYDGLPSADQIMHFIGTGASNFEQGKYIHASTATYSNFYIRSILGHDVYMLPAGGITERHLELAKRRLDKFGVVMILEHFERDRVQLQRKFGWTRMALDCTKPTQPMMDFRWLNETICKDKTAPVIVPEKHGDVEFSNNQLEMLAAANKLDIEFYDYAKRVAARLSASA